MSLLSKNGVVQYACTCGQLKAITNMYFCRHCLKLRCGFCVCHEVDSHYCSNCLEILPSAEARLKKNRCQTCFDCPNCLNTLAVRGSTVSVWDPDDPNKVSSQKKYYHACFFCRWTTRDVGLPDQAVQTVSVNGWAQKEANSSNIQRVTTLLERARLLGTMERHEKEQKEKKFTPRSRRTFTHLPGLTSAQVRKRAGLPAELPAPSTIKDTLAEFRPAIAKEEVAELPEDIFTNELDISGITTMSQRLAQPEIQPVSKLELLPSYKHLSTKRSQRCRECEHNVSKPELNPASTKFKIQQAAYFHVPEIRLVTAEPLIGMKECQVVFLLSNPSQHPTSLSFMSIEDAEDEAKKQTDASEEQGEAFDSVTSSSMLVPINVKVTANVQLPPVDEEIMLPPKDDAAEYDYSGETLKSHNDPKWVVHRRANKAAVSLKVTPHTECAGKDCTFGFVLRYTYVNRIPSPGSFDPKPQEVQLYTQLFVNCGKILKISN